MNNDEKFYNKVWFMWVMLIVFAPVGIYLLWRSKYSKLAKIIITSVFGLFFILAVFSENDDKDYVDKDKVAIEEKEYVDEDKEENEKDENEKGEIEKDEIDSKEESRDSKPSQEKVNEEKKDESKVKEEEYTDNISLYFSELSGYFDDFSKHSQELGANSELMYDEDFLRKYMSVVVSIDLVLDKIEELTPPEKYKDVHDEIMKAVNLYRSIRRDLPAALDNMDSDAINSVTRDIIEGNNYLEKATQMLLEIK